jgi:hypothetical protein
LRHVALGSAFAWWSGDGHLARSQGTNHGNAAEWRDLRVRQKFGEAFVFDGVNDYVETPLDVQPRRDAESTWECWVFPPAATFGRFQILSSDDGGIRSLRSVGKHCFGVFTGFGFGFPSD